MWSVEMRSEENAKCQTLSKFVVDPLAAIAAESDFIAVIRIITGS